MSDHIEHECPTCRSYICSGCAPTPAESNHMTPDKTPTDAQLQSAYDSVPAHGNQQDVHIAGLRAVLAKWGSPVVAGPDDDINAMGLARYKVVPAHESMFHRFAVVAGDGQQQLYLGRETECQNMARKFAGAFLDGAFYHSRATQPTQAQAGAMRIAEGLLSPAIAALDRARIRDIFMAHGFTVKDGQTDLKQYVYDAADALLRAARTPADSVLEDAALLKEARDALWQPAYAELCERIDAYLDAARKQGANHDNT